MKAFQLKIAIKNSKPPIWRRVIVPTGITFTQLSMILNEVMGWCGYHMFEFEFYHQELRVMEGAEEFGGIGPYDYLEASTTFIREYMEENEWFTYTYDLGDDWQHRVTIEKIIDNWEKNFPKVVKYKGDCPIEDCGGIYGYYDCLDVISDEKHPEYQDRLEWMKSQGYPQKYDMEYVNQLLREEFFYIWGKGEKRCQSEIYEEHFNGKYGIKATKSDKNKNVNRIRSDKHRMEDSLQKAADLLNAYVNYQKKLEEKMFSVSTLKDIFEDYSKEDLVEIAKEKGITGISGCRKKQVIDKLYAHMMNEEEIKKYFYCMTSEEREEFENAVQCRGFYESDKSGYLLKIYKASYISMLEDGRIIVPEDVKDMYFSIKGTVFEKECEKRSFVLSCLETVGLLYGIVPFDIFMELINRSNAPGLSKKEIRQIIAEIPVEYMDYMIKGDKIYHKELFPDDRGLLEVQGDKDYYIPTKEEIRDLGATGYLPKDESMVRFKRYMVKHLDAMEDEVEIAGCIIWRLICGNCEMQEIFEFLENLGLMVDSEKELHMLIREINKLWNNTRQLLNRGFTPNELAKNCCKNKKDNV